MTHVTETKPPAKSTIIRGHEKAKAARAASNLQTEKGENKRRKNARALEKAANTELLAHGGEAEARPLYDKLADSATSSLMGGKSVRPFASGLDRPRRRNSLFWGTT